MPNPLYTYDTLPSTSAAALREFDDRYLAALMAAPASGWQDQFGALAPTDAPMLTFPVSQMRTKYQKTLGENRFKTLQEKSFDVKVEEFDDGYEARLYDLFTQVFAYRNWQRAPERFVIAEGVHRAANIAALIEAGSSTACVDGANFFSTSHPANLFDGDVGTWSNLSSGGTDVVSVANLQTEVSAMQTQVLDENGDELGVMPDTILVPTAKFEALKNLLKKEQIASAAGTASETNPYMNGFNIVPVREFTDANDWFLVDSKLIAQGLEPWVSVRQTMPASLALRHWDEASDFFKDTGKIKVSSHIWYGFALAFPHAIRKVVGA